MKSAPGCTREIADMKRETEQAWSSERVENALLRERINDVAAEVARLASALEGPNSPIDAILAEQTARDTATMPVTASDIVVVMPRRNRPMATSPIASARCNRAHRACRTPASRPATSLA